MKDESRTWLEYAQDDLRVAAVVQRVSVAATAYHAQQAVEKALKALLTERDMTFRKSHDIGYLNGLLDPDDQILLTEEALDKLSEWASNSRYPDDLPAPVASDAEEALGWAVAALDHIAAKLRSSPSSAER